MGYNDRTTRPGVHLAIFGLCSLNLMFHGLLGYVPILVLFSEVYFSVNLGEVSYVLSFEEERSLLSAMSFLLLQNAISSVIFLLLFTRQLRARLFGARRISHESLDAFFGLLIIFTTGCAMLSPIGFSIFFPEVSKINTGFLPFTLIMLSLIPAVTLHGVTMCWTEPERL